MSLSAGGTKKNVVVLVPVLVAAVVAVVLIAGAFYLNRPVAKPVETGASQAEKAYLANLALSDVSMQATENFMNQKVVEVLGKITNNGPRELASIDVYCLFYSVDGRLLHRERLRIVGGLGSPGSLKSAATKVFRLPFDSLPDGWNQALPKMVIAQIVFAP